MFSSWLKRHSSKTKAGKQSALVHAVLGTPLDAPLEEGQAEIFFACGCFWGAEKSFWKLPGVLSTTVGYAGGHLQNPTYKEVCRGDTGHTEIVRVVWDKNCIDISDLLKMFWECHDPTQGNRQGNDRGSQYRSAIYTNTSDHLELAFASKDSYQQSLSENGYTAITTEISLNKPFYHAENYHQQYLARPGSRPYCSAMPTKIKLKSFKGCNFKLPEGVWSHFDWSISHCVLRSDNRQITLDSQTST